ncbi:hypothetical protein CCR75_002279 [Bremia lactucae]|uniref:Secreted RxLR effector peptide protein n=1 Tax=Bremia lactucae TaxID=4779 RepID=A0A976IEN2_BRELC|nr:hypothetical protein CCR75_002279 [Bremia lactucae]
MRTTFFLTVVIAMFCACITAIETLEGPTTTGREPNSADATPTVVARALRGAVAFNEDRLDLEGLTNSVATLFDGALHEINPELVRTAKALTP